MQSNFGTQKGAYLFFEICFLLSILSLISCNNNSTINKNSENSKNFVSQASGDKLINGANFSFPGGKLKCLVMSFDDGSEHDHILLNKLNKTNIKGTFHFNSGRLGEKAEWLSQQLGYDVHFVTKSELRTMYTGHEISGHGRNHAGLTDVPDSIIRVEVSADLESLNSVVENTDHNTVQGLAYPFGTYNDQTLKILSDLGVKYARTVASTENFELPLPNFLTLNPTCHIFDAPNFCSYFAYHEPQEMQVLNIWGHSYEFHNNWKLADTIFDIVGNCNDIWYAKTIELVDYLDAIKNLSYSNDSVFNPSSEITVWVKNHKGSFVKLPPMQSMSVQFQSSYIESNEIDSLYPDHSINIKYHGDWTRVNYKHRIANFKKSPLNFDDIVFIGNSITEYGGNWGGKLENKKVRNRGIAGDVTDGVLRRLDEITYYKPQAVFILIGINDLFNLHFQKEIPSPEYVASNIIEITNIIHNESPDTKIYLQTILPTSKEYMIENISTINTILSKYDEESAYELIDLHKVFVDDNGLIKPELTTDGTHLNELGYKLWVETIKDKI